MDGSFYQYTAPSKADFEIMCDQMQRGRFFNFAVRRADLGFTKSFSPPPDYEVIYEYPPYEGTAPSDCLPCVDCTGKNRDISAVMWQLTENLAVGSITGSGVAFTLEGMITGMFGGSVEATPDELCFQPSYDITVTWSVTTDSSFVVLSIFIGGFVVLNDEVVVNGDFGSMTFTVPESENDTEFIIIADDGTTSVDFTLSPGSPP